jgi:MSHA pilin protein MshC
MHIADPLRTASRPRRNFRRGQCGFTLIELIMVIVLMGVLAVFAAPRVFNSGDFYARGFHDETLGLLRYAQKTAIAQRRTVCVTFTNSGAETSVALTLASAATTSDCSVASMPALAGPRGEVPAKVTARAGVVFATTPTNFNYDGLGQPIAASGGAAISTRTLQVASASGNASASITVEAATGYAHE